MAKREKTYSLVNWHIHTHEHEHNHDNFFYFVAHRVSIIWYNSSSSYKLSCEQCFICRFSSSRAKQKTETNRYNNNNKSQIERLVVGVWGCRKRFALANCLWLRNLFHVTREGLWNSFLWFTRENFKVLQRKKASLSAASQPSRTRQIVFYFAFMKRIFFILF